jgi:hypothetical protein
MSQSGSPSLPSAGVTSPVVPSLTAVPVALALGERHVGSVRRWLEGTLGWQAVEDDPDGPVPPAVRLVDLDGARRMVAAHRDDVGGRTGHGSAGLPIVLLVEDDDAPASCAEAARLLAPSGVCRWPEGRESLPDLVARALRAPRRSETSARVLRVGGTAGGVGTTTVVLALAGLGGWAGRRSLAVIHGNSGVRDAAPVPPDAVVAPDLWARATPLPGVPDARVVHTGDVPARLVPADRRIDVAVLDVGTDSEVDVVVTRPDGAATQLPATMAGAVVVVGEGLLSADRLRELAGGRLVVHLPSSVRVARAVLRGHVPTGLPGRWLAELAPLVVGT